MIDEYSVLGVILARGGSKGLPRKNIRQLGGKPLIGWTIEAGQGSECIDRLILSSDNEEIIRIAERNGCEVPFQRPDELAQDETKSIDALLHAVDQVPFHDYVVLLQPTSPLRTARDIDDTVAMCHEMGAPSCVTLVETSKPPEWMYTLGEGNRVKKVVKRNGTVHRRQDAETTYVVNGSVYVGRMDWVKKKCSFVSDNTVGKVMPRKRSIDIDNMMDLRIAECILNYGE
ncbi:cytidylyltransferase domain-containing protein [Salinibacter ruber]|uniref:acylneuraminate cytidylyltransferase family protein n=1 Tax=Salinibacter ruber TaxID=146919 RepID=UPI00216A3FF8|nr:acylneuraminate cytidylyltransferase family protein [Salinibacter ruber]MCS4049228.1 N-acylneuraminate cytidylyltransferase [Salinibacter ruber]